MADSQTLTREHTELMATLAQRRFFLRYTVRDLTPEQAAARPTASQLCLGGLIKHVTDMERGWIAFAVHGTSAMPNEDEIDYAAREASWSMQPGETLAGVLADYEKVAAQTEAALAGLPNLDQAYPLPVAPWFPPGAQWSIRQVLLHLIGETSQHAGHADILRESLDGAKTMG